MPVECEPAEGGRDPSAGFTFIQRIGVIEAAERFNILFKRDSHRPDESQKRIQAPAALSPLCRNVLINGYRSRRPASPPVDVTTHCAPSPTNDLGRKIHDRQQ